jgi:hypothetical protein
MLRVVAWLALALSVVACGDEKGGKDETNLGAPCNAETDCKGAVDTCLSTQILSGFGVAGGGIVKYQDGYCSSACKRDTECGTGGACPVGEALASADIPQMYRGVADQILASASNCYKPCSSASACRDGYQCSTIPAALTGDSATTLVTATVLEAVLAGSISTDKYCLPIGGTAADAGADGG